MLFMTKIEGCETKYSGKIAVVMHLGGSIEIDHYVMNRINYDLREDVLDEMIFIVPKEYWTEQTATELAGLIKILKQKHNKKDFRVLVRDNPENTVSDRALKTLRSLCIGVSEYKD
jgi:hypothetical protein